jgi:hypothetical protein
MNDSSWATKPKFLVALLAVLALVVVSLRSRHQDKAATASSAASSGSPSTARPTSSRARTELASDGLPIMPAGPNEPVPDGPVHPHPITPEHERIFEENRLIGALNGAMDVKDVPAMRKFLEQYREQYPEDDHMIQGGYSVIADCLEHPGRTSRAAAERWADDHRGSTLRRFVQRHCLEP